MKNTSDQDVQIPSASSNVTLPSSNQTQKKKSPKLTNKETSSSTSSRPKQDSDTPQPCTECGKKFGSLKALYGHMRCHPERQWRGINPPSSLNASEEENDVASSLLMLSKGGGGGSTDSSGFQCGGCKKVFGSHQALRGHRATHKHVKGCFAMTNLIEDPPPPPQEIVDQEDKSKNLKSVSRTNHQCNICFRVFSSGQALGGHMRSHSEKNQGEKKDAAIDLNVPTETSSYPSLGCSLDLKLGL